MKKTLLSLMVMGMAANVSAATTGPVTAANTFQWQGTVPAITGDLGDLEIVQTGTTGLMNGVLEFANSNGVVTLPKSSELAFNVVKKADKSPVSSYSFKLVNVKVGQNADPIIEQTDGLFAVKADGTTLVKDGSLTTKNAGGETVLTVGFNDGVVPTMEANDKVTVQAVIEITATNA